MRPTDGGIFLGVRVAKGPEDGRLALSVIEPRRLGVRLGRSRVVASSQPERPISMHRLVSAARVRQVDHQMSRVLAVGRFFPFARARGAGRPSDLTR